jgi:predicted O-linked N-acetylglucosamine transferase (SPINDLY family)
MQGRGLGNAALAQRMGARMKAAGIDMSRVALCEGTSRAAYLAAHAEVDIILDTFPYPGGTTTCEALWMGVPTVTLEGATMLARQGASMLSAAGLDDWVAGSLEDYVALAVRKAGDPASLAALRAAMRGRISSTPLFDARRFARSLEEALSGMWSARTPSA